MEDLHNIVEIVRGVVRYLCFPTLCAILAWKDESRVLGVLVWFFFACFAQVYAFAPAGDRLPLVASLSRTAGPAGRSREDLPPAAPKSCRRRPDSAATTGMSSRPETAGGSD